MRRRWRTILLAASLALLAFTLVTWARSYRRLDWLGRTWDSGENEVARMGQFGVGWGSGGLSITFYETIATPLPGQSLASIPGVPKQPWAQSRWQWRTVGPRLPHGVMFDVSTKWKKPMSNVTNVRAVESDIHLAVPHWFVALLTAAYPAYHFYGHRRRLQRYRREHNLCLACGYDLRESTDRCPECGQLAHA